VADVHDTQTRSKNMAAIKGRDTKPELIIRKALHHAGFRYRLHAKDLPGKPDLVLPKYNSALFINGCFWHRHDCHLFKWPGTRQDFWKKKIMGNVANDQKKLAMLHDAGWRTGIVWECALKGKTRISEDEAIQHLSEWLKSDHKIIEIQGQTA
jgi:DNA mismatch endonuclease (patch repair protein)